VVEHGNGTYDANVPENPLCHPLLRDTSVAYPSPAYNDGLPSGTPAGVPQAPCGWLKIRFVANNPGTWLFHCHVDWHVEMGMAVVFEVAPTKIPAPPKMTPVCGAVPFVQGYPQAPCSSGAMMTATYSVALLLLGVFLAFL